MATVSVMPAAEAKGLKPNYLGTLYEVESDLLALSDTEEMVPPALVDEFKAALRGSADAAIQKRNSVYRALQSFGANQKTMSDEIARLQQQKKRSANAENRIRGLVKSVIEALGSDGGGKYHKLKCDYCTFSVRANPDQVEVIDPDALPDRFKTIQVELPLELWNGLVARTHGGGAAQDDAESALLRAGTVGRIGIDETLVRAAIQDGEEVPGADIRMGELSLVVR